MCVGCDAGSPEHASEREYVETEPDQPPGPTYYPDDDRVGNPAVGVVLTDQKIADDRAAALAERLRYLSPAGWYERISPHVKTGTSVVIARLLEDRGTKYSDETHTALVEVLEHLAGPSPSSNQLEVIQGASGGRPQSCGGLQWKDGLVVALALEPAVDSTGARAILAPSPGETVGWAIQVGPDTFESYGSVAVDRATLESLGGGQ